MTMPTREEIRDQINETLSAKLSGKSFISELGAEAFSDDITKLMWPIVSFPGLAFEGTKKPSTTVSVGETDVVRGKLIHMARYTDEFEDSQNGKKFLAKTVASMAASFAPALDATITHGVDPQTGLVNTALTHSIVKDGTEAPIALGTAIDVTLDEIIAASEDATGIALSPQAFRAMAELRTTGGVKQFPSITPFADFPYGWVKARVSDQVSYPGKKGDVADSTIRAIAGPWADIVRAARVANVDILTAGNPDSGATDLGAYNQKVLRIEMHFAYAIREGENFIVAKLASV